MVFCEICKKNQSAINDGRNSLVFWIGNASAFSEEASNFFPFSVRRVKGDGSFVQSAGIDMNRFLTTVYKIILTTVYKMLHNLHNAQNTHLFIANHTKKHPCLIF